MASKHSTDIGAADDVGEGRLIVELENRHRLSEWTRHRRVVECEQRAVLGGLRDLQLLDALSAAHLQGAPAKVLADRITLVYTGVLGMILRGSDAEAAIADGRATAALVIRALAGGDHAESASRP